MTGEVVETSLKALAARVYEALRLSPEHTTGAPNELINALEDVANAVSSPV